MKLSFYWIIRRFYLVKVSSVFMISVFAPLCCKSYNHPVTSVHAVKVIEAQRFAGVSWAVNMRYSQHYSSDAAATQDGDH